jgi:hypothetical protein
MLTRRAFLGATGAATLAAIRPAAFGPPVVDAATPKRVAIVATIYTHLSHAQHMGDRLLVGYPRDGKWHRPPVQVVSLYVDQKPDGDLSSQRAAEHGFRVYPTIAETLRCGGEKLAVDAVVIIAEHGDYPRNEKSQVLYPRYEFFQSVVEVFEQDGRAVPVFNDKHLSYSWKKAKKMVADSKRLKFPMLAGSSVPVTWRLPPVEVPYGAQLEEALMIGIGGSDQHDFHALEGLQCMVERRKGGETGIKSVQMIEGDAVWKAGEDGRWSMDLLEAALSRSDSLQGVSELDSRTQNLARNGLLPGLVKKPAAYFIERNDGLRTTLLMLNGALENFTFAARLQGGDVVSTQFFLPPTPNVNYSACLVSQIEEMIVSGHAPYPVERTQITSAMLDRCLDSKVNGHRRIETPELDITYTAPRESLFGDG